MTSTLPIEGYSIIRFNKKRRIIKCIEIKQHTKIDILIVRCIIILKKVDKNETYTKKLIF